MLRLFFSILSFFDFLTKLFVAKIFFCHFKDIDVQNTNEQFKITCTYFLKLYIIEKVYLANFG